MGSCLIHIHLLTLLYQVPAGLVDEGESAETCAVRELKEETGYVGEVLKGNLGVTPVMFNGSQFLTTYSYRELTSYHS